MKQYSFTISGQGASYDYSQDNCSVKLSSMDTSGQICIVEDTLKPGFNLDRHHHKQMTEVFYVLDGEVRFLFDEVSLIAKKGDTITIPPNVWHAASSPKGGRMLTIFKDGIFDFYLDALAYKSNEEFENKELMKSLSETYDIYE